MFIYFQCRPSLVPFSKKNLRLRNNFSINLPCKMLVTSRFVPTFISYTYVTVDLIKIISLLILWVLVISSRLACINVKYVSFQWNLSILPRRY